MSNLLYTLTKFGPEFLYSVVDAMNRGLSQKEIAAAWHTDEATISRVVNKFLKPVWQLDEMTVELMDAYQQVLMTRYERTRGPARVFQLGADSK